MIMTSQSAAAIAKRALGDKCYQASVNKIIDNLPLDPELSGADGIILTQSDFAGPAKLKLRHALKTRHPKTAVIYFYSGDAQSELADTEYKKKISQLTVQNVKDAVEEFMGGHAVKGFDPNYVSADDVAAPGEYAPPARSPDPEPPELPRPEPVFLPKREPPPELPEPLRPEPDPVPKRESAPTLEEQLAAMRGFQDWDMLKNAVKRDTVTRRLIEENSEYQGVLTMIDVFENRMRTVFGDRTLSHKEKLDELKKIGFERLALKESEHGIYAGKLLSVFDAVTGVASRAVSERVAEVEDAVKTLVTAKNEYLNGIGAHELQQKRFETNLELLGLVRGIIDVYKAMDNAVAEEIDSFDKNVPFSSGAVNELLDPLKRVFLPKNAPGLAQSLMSALQEKRLTLSAVETKIDAAMKLVFRCMEEDEEVIAYQQKIIEFLKANRVEDVIIRDSLIKEVLRVFAGGDNSGRTATALMYAGCSARKRNTLVIDLSKNSKLRDYGIEPITPAEFIAGRVERELLFTADNHDYDPERLAALIADVRERVQYYASVVVILDDGQTAALNQLSRDALSVTYVTDCGKDSLNAARKIIREHTADNVARKLAVIDPPLPVHEIAADLGADILTTKVQVIPYLKAVRKCSLTGKPPFEDEDLRTIYAEALR
jgi:hypothetical protein